MHSAYNSGRDRQKTNDYPFTFLFRFSDSLGKPFVRFLLELVSRDFEEF